MKYKSVLSSDTSGVLPNNLLLSTVFCHLSTENKQKPTELLGLSGCLLVLIYYNKSKIWLKCLGQTSDVS